MGRPVIIDPGGGSGGGGGGPAGVAVPAAGLTFTTPVELVFGPGIAWTPYPEQKRILISAPNAPALCYKAADEAFAATALADAASLSFALAADATYAFRFNIGYLSSLVTEALILALNGPAGAANLDFFIRIYTAAAVLGEYQKSAYESGSTNTDGTITERSATIEGTVENGATAGTLVVRAAAETAIGASVTIKRGSHGMLWRLS